MQPTMQNYKVERWWTAEGLFYPDTWLARKSDHGRQKTGNSETILKKVSEVITRRPIKQAGRGQVALVRDSQAEDGWKVQKWGHVCG